MSIVTLVRFFIIGLAMASVVPAMGATEPIWLTPNQNYQKLFMYQQGRPPKMNRVAAIRYGDMVRVLPDRGPEGWKRVELPRDGKPIKGWVRTKFFKTVSTSDGDHLSEAETCDGNCREARAKVVPIDLSKIGPRVVVSSRNRVGTFVESRNRKRVGTFVSASGRTRVASISGSQSLIWPTVGKLNHGVGPRHGRYHYGIDIVGNGGADVVAARSGTIVKSSWENGGWGKYIKVWHPDIRKYSLYAHLDPRCASFSEGTTVSAGQKIGCVGETGNAEGKHLHFELRNENDEYYNPLEYLPPLHDNLIS